jgi:hypothetical protein
MDSHPRLEWNSTHDPSIRVAKTQTSDRAVTAIGVFNVCKEINVNCAATRLASALNVHQEQHGS